MNRFYSETHKSHMLPSLQGTVRTTSLTFQRDLKRGGQRGLGIMVRLRRSAEVAGDFCLLRLM